MGKPYSCDLRGRFVAALDEGMSAGAAGRRMRISRATAVRWAATWQQEGRAEALPMGGDRRSEALEVHAPKSAAGLGRRRICSCARSCRGWPMQASRHRR